MQKKSKGDFQVSAEDAPSTYQHRIQPFRFPGFTAGHFLTSTAAPRKESAANAGVFNGWDVMLIGFGVFKTWES